MFTQIRKLINHLKSHIRFKIILPYAILTLMVAIIGVYLSVRLVSEPLEERFKGELIEAGRVVANGLAQREQLHLTIFRSIAFTEGIDEAVQSGDRDKLAALVYPIVTNASIDRVDVLDADGRQLLEIHRPPGTTSVEAYKTSKLASDTSRWPFQTAIQKVLNGVVEQGRDKYVALATLDDEQLFITIGPVKQVDQTGEEKVVGAVLVSSYTEGVLTSLRQLTSAEITLYDLEGNLINTTFSSAEEAADALAIDPKDAHLLLRVEGDSSRQRSATIRGRGFDLLFGVFWARNEPLGFYSVVKETTFVESIGVVRNLMVLIFAVALLLVFGIGYLTANTITGRVRQLMENAMAVARGDYTRRSTIASSDEIGMLGQSLDYMTESLANKIFELTVLHRNSTDMTGKTGPNLDHSLEALVSSVKEAIRGIDEVVIYLLDQEREILVPRSLVTSGIHTFPPLSFADDTRMQALLAEARPRLISLPDLETHAVNGSFSANGLSQIILAPLIAGQEIIGLLTLTPDSRYPRPDVLDNDMAQLLATLANQAAISIKNDQLFEETQRAYEDLRQLDTLKTEFINIAAHELRTPLGGIILAANYVEKRGEARLQKKAHAIIVSAVRMRTMVDAMLTIQRLDAGTAFLRATSIDVRDVLKKVIADFQPLAELEGHIITVKLPDVMDPINADAEKVGLVLSNLISNAIKFTPEAGRIEVGAEDYKLGVRISVRDNGVGISPEDQQAIFERFHQVRPEHMAGHGGLGLGLTIVKHLVDLHNGQVWVESEPGKGSTFYFTLPRTEPEEAGEPPRSTTDKRLQPSQQDRALEPT